MSLLAQNVDIVAYDRDGQLLLVGDVESRVGTSPEWAAAFRKSLLDYDAVPRVPYFFIATPDRLYFWRQDQTASPGDLPSFTMDLSSELRRYFELAPDLSPDTIGRHALELIFSAWLSDLARSQGTRLSQGSSRQWLIDSGLLASLCDARIEITTR